MKFWEWLGLASSAVTVFCYALISILMLAVCGFCSWGIIFR